MTRAIVYRKSTYRRSIAAVTLAVLMTMAVRPASARPTEADPYGVGPYRSCEDKIDTTLTEAVNSLIELDERIRAVPPEKAAFFAREEPHIFDTRDPQRMGALFGDPYYSLWMLHARVRALADGVRRFSAAQQRPLSAAGELWLAAQLTQDFTSAMSVLTLAATGHAREDGPDSPPVLTEEQIATYQQNLQGIAMYVAEYGRCRATLELRRAHDVAKR